MKRATAGLSLSVAAMILILAAVAWWKLGGYYSVSIINIANFQSQLQPFAEAGEDGLTQNSFGGAAYLRTAIDDLKKIRPAALVTESGDLVMGTWWHFWGGEPEFTIANLLGIEAGMLGNHEFNLGLAHLQQALARYAGFPVLATNIHFEDPELAGLLKKTLVLTTADGLKVGLFSLVPTRLVTLTRAGEGLRIDPDLVGTARAAVADLRAQDVQAIVLLSHASLEEDLALAGQVEGISLVITGDDAYGDRPGIRWVSGPGGWVTGVATFSGGGQTLSAFTLTLHRGRPVPDMTAVDTLTVSRNLPPNPEMAALVESYDSRMDALLSQPIGSFATPVDARKKYVRTGPAPLGDFIADAFRLQSGARLAVINAGDIRGDRIFPAGPVSARTILEIMPFHNQVLIKELTGKQIRQMLEFSASALVGLNDEYNSAERIAPGGFLHVSGLTVTVALGAVNQPIQVDDRGEVVAPGNRVKYIGVLDGGRWETLNDGETYTVAMPDFLGGGGDKYAFLAGVPTKNTRVLDSEMVIDYLKNRPNARLSLRTDGRIKIEGRSGR